MTRTVVSLNDKYTQESGQVVLTALQALVRLLLDQARRDKAADLVTGDYVSGYRGSPMTTLDAQLWNAEKLLRQHDIRFGPGLNEELAACWMQVRCAARSSTGWRRWGWRTTRCNFTPIAWRRWKMRAQAWFRPRSAQRIFAPAARIAPALSYRRAVRQWAPPGVTGWPLLCPKQAGRQNVLF